MMGPQVNLGIWISLCPHAAIHQHNRDIVLLSYCLLIADSLGCRVDSLCVIPMVIVFCQKQNPSQIAKRQMRFTLGRLEFHWIDAKNPRLWSNRTMTIIFWIMSSVIGIDVGFRSQYVAKVIPSAEGNAEPAIETQLNESKENEFKSVQRDGIDE